MNILIWGTGRMARNAANDMDQKVNIIGFIDNDKARQNGLFCGRSVYSPQDAVKTEFDFVLIAVALVAQEIYDQLTVQLKIHREKILSLGHFWDPGALTENYAVVENALGLKLKYTESSVKPADLVLLRKMEWDSCSKSIIRNQASSIYDLDYMRYRTFELCAEELLLSTDPAVRESSVAEIGVYRGDFAKIINETFPYKKLFLFDTFDGFDDAEYRKDRQTEGVDASYINNFKDTSVELVLNRMPHRENCVIKKGFFPKTTADCGDLKFCFVSIDVDLFDPIYNSLEFFFPRLVEGGYLFIHEYNHGHYTGVKKAVSQYEERFGKIRKIPIADKNGTLIVTK